jgi:UBA/TS-N domain
MTNSDLDQLIDMGFDEERAKLAISNSGGRTYSTTFPLLRICIHMTVLYPDDFVCFHSAGCPRMA